MTTTDTATPYTMAEQPTSPARAFLARAFAHWCALHEGLSPEEVAAALDDGADVDPLVRRRVAGATRLIGEILATGSLRAWTRPVGGGIPVPMDPATWELDDYRARMAASGVALDQPFASDLPATHWIFVELEDFNGLVEASCADPGVPAVAGRPAKPAAEADGRSTDPRNASEPGARPERYVRLAEVMRRTGMSRSTIYNRIRNGRFPGTVDMTGNIAAWRESEIEEWLASPS